MAIALKSKASGVTAGTGATVNVTTAETIATAVGDIVVVLFGDDFYAITDMGTPTATGSPTLTSITTVDGGTNTTHVKGYWYQANTAGAQTISATAAHTDEDKILLALVFSGVDTTTPIDGTPTTTVGSASSTNVAPAVSPAGSNSYFVTCVANAVGKSYTTPAPLTEQIEAVATGFLDMVVGTEQLSASGSTGTFSFTPSGSCAYVAMSFTLKTASGGGGITGTLAVTQANNTSAATGVLGYSGTLARTQANNTVAAAGTFTPSGISGSVAVTQANNTAVATGVLGYSGTLARTQANNTVAASGTFVGGPISGTLAVTQAPNTAVAVGVITGAGAPVAPASRTLVIGPEQRAYTVPPEARTTIITADNRTDGVTP